MTKKEGRLLWMWNQVKEKKEISKSVLVDMIRGKYLITKYVALDMVELLMIGAEIHGEKYGLKGDNKLSIDSELNNCNIKIREEVEAYRIELKKKLIREQANKKIEVAEKKQQEEIFNHSVEDNKEVGERIFGEQNATQRPTEEKRI